MKYGAQNHSSELKAGEIDSLKHIRDFGLYRKVLPEETVSSLMEKRFVSQGLGGHMLTDEGNYALQLYEPSEKRVMS